MSTGLVEENTFTSAANTSTSDVPPGFGPETMKAIFEMNQKLKCDNEILLRQITDMRTLIEQGRESREADKASLELLKAQLAQQQNTQGPYPPNREYGPWTTDASSVRVPPYPPYQHQ